MSTISWPTHQAVREMRGGVLLGKRTCDVIVPRPREGRHVQLGMRVFPGGAGQWFLLIKDQTGEGRHRKQGIIRNGVPVWCNGRFARVTAAGMYEPLDNPDNGG